MVIICYQLRFHGHQWQLIEIDNNLIAISFWESKAGFASTKIDMGLTLLASFHGSLSVEAFSVEAFPSNHQQCHM